MTFERELYHEGIHSKLLDNIITYKRLKLDL